MDLQLATQNGRVLMRSATAGVVFRHSPLRPLFITSSDRGRQYDHDRRNTRERNAHGSGVVKLFLFFDRRPSFLTLGDVSSRLLCENPVVRGKIFRLVTSLALVSTAQPLGGQVHPTRESTSIGAPNRHIIATGMSIGNPLSHIGGH